MVANLIHFTNYSLDQRDLCIKQTHIYPFFSCKICKFLWNSKKKKYTKKLWSVIIPLALRIILNILAKTSPQFIKLTWKHFPNRMLLFKMQWLLLNDALCWRNVAPTLKKNSNAYHCSIYGKLWKNVFLLSYIFLFYYE